MAWMQKFATNGPGWTNTAGTVIHDTGKAVVAQPGKSLVLRGISFHDYDWAIDLTTPGDPIPIVLIEDCTFTSCERAVAGWQQGPRIGSFVFRNNVVAGCTEYGLKLSNHFENATITGNVFQNAGMTAILCGENGDKRDCWKNAVIADNFVSSQATEKQTIGICAIGYHHMIARNTVCNMYVNGTGRQDTAEGIYCKVQDGVVIDNTLINAGGYEGQLVLKGEDCQSVCVRNTIVMTSNWPSRQYRSAMFNCSNPNLYAENTIYGEASEVTSQSSHPVVRGGNQVFGIPTKRPV